MAKVSGVGVRGRPRLGYIDGVKVALISRGSGGSATMEKQGVENPVSYVDDCVSHGHFFLVPVIFRNALQRLVAHHLVRSGMPLRDAVGVN